jgi:hypothetical protein
MLIRVSFEMIEQSRRDAMRGDVLSAYVSARNFVTLWNYLGYMTVGREHV